MVRIRFAFTCVALVLIVVLTACGTAQPAAPTAMPATMPGMDHGSMAMNDAPFDAQFIDSMIMHHEGAIAMAKQAQSEAERPEIRQLADAIITAQQAEITQMKEWRSMWYPDLAPTNGMGMDMGSMMIGSGTTAFDQRFLEAMIPHHQSAIIMAKQAQQKAEHPEIRQLADAIITAQEAEITQMKQWLKDWFGVG